MCWISCYFFLRPSKFFSLIYSIQSQSNKCGAKWLSADETSLNRVGAKKAVRHVVSKRWWPTEPVSFSEASFQEKKYSFLVPWKILLKYLVLKPFLHQNLDSVLGTENWVETLVEGQALSAGRLVREAKHINRFSLEEGL